MLWHLILLHRYHQMLWGLGTWCQWPYTWNRRIEHLQFRRKYGLCVITGLQEERCKIEVIVRFFARIEGLRTCGHYEHISSAWPCLQILVVKEVFFFLMLEFGENISRVLVKHEREEYCFESTVSEERTNSLSSAPNSVSSADKQNSVSSLWHTNDTMRGTHWILSQKLSEGPKTHWAQVWSRPLWNRVRPVSDV